MRCLALAFALALAVGTLCASEALPPVAIQLERPGVVTVVVERADGTRVANLTAGLRLPAGSHRFAWDGYDVGLQVDKDQPHLRHLAGAGTYCVRGLVHDGVDLRYEFSVYSPGETPWKNTEGTGSWLGDHSVDADCLYLPPGTSSKGPGAQMLLSTACSEAGTAIAWCDLEGHKLGSHVWGWDGAFALARDAAAGADPTATAYALHFGVLRCLRRDGSSQEVYRWTPAKPFPCMNDIWAFVDIAVHDRIAVIANSDNRDNVDTTSGNLLVLDLTTGAVLANHATAPSRGVAFGPDGKLYAVLGNDVRRFSLDRVSGALHDEGAVIAGLDEPRRVRVAPDGTLVVGVWGRQHQVQVHDQEGRLLRVIGTPGGPQIGAYDEQRMDRPEGLGIAADGVLWVAENSHVPKRTSLWDLASGRFLRAIYGRPQYGSGGQLDPYDRGILRHCNLVSASEQALMEFSLDWQAGSGRLVNIAYRSPLITRDRAQAYHQSDPTVPVQPSQEHMPWLDGPFRCTPPPSWPVRAGGHRFLYTQGISRHGFPGIATLWNADESLIRPVAAFGFASELLAGTNPFAGSARQFAEIKAALPDEAHRFGFIWSDLDADQHMQPGEFQFLPFDEKIPFIIGTHIEPDLALTFLNLEFGRVPAPTFNDRGIPVWNGSAHQRLVTSQGTISFHHEAGVPLVGERDVVLSMWGWEHYTPIQGFARDGGLRWTWRTYAEGAVPQTPAQVAMAYSVAGGVIRPHAGEAGEIWLTGGSKGANYLFTTDGLLVATLGGHLANTPMWRMPHLARGASLTGVSFEDEAFQTSLQQYQNGDIYGVFGKEHISICRLAGLETVRRMDWGTYTLTQDQVAGLPEVLAETPRPSYRQRLAVVHGGTAPVIDGSLDDWAGADWAVIDPRCRAAVRIVGDRLYAAYRTGDPDLLANQAEDHRFLFKRGGALDLCLGPAPETNQHHWELRDLRQECGPDDRRLLVSLVRGQPVATLYRPVLPDPRPTQRERFESPVGRCDMDAVLDLSKHIELAGQHGDFEFAVSLADLCGLPVPGPTGDLLGDLGIIRGDGQQNIQRACWNNIDTAMTSDIPTEVRLNPATWGVFHLQPDTP